VNTDSRERLLAHLAVDEGCVLYAYPDSLGYLTIGYGRLIDRRRGGGITNAEALMLLENDVERHWRELVHRFPWVEGLDDVRQVAMCNLAFNLGINGLAQFRNTLAAIQRADWPAAVQGLRQSLWFRQVGKSRSDRILHMIGTGEYPSA
jgi:lysozyme